MSLTIIWSVIALVLLIIEISLGTVYLLAVFVGAIFGVISTYFTEVLAYQLTVVSVVTLIGLILAFYKRRYLRFKSKDDFNDLDMGNIVMVDSINEDGSASVHYRGASWRALADIGPLEKGRYKIFKIQGSTLILSKEEK